MKDDLSGVSGQTVTINADIQSMSDEVKISGLIFHRQVCLLTVQVAYGKLQRHYCGVQH